MKNALIGFFDSGIGGLTIWKEVVSLLPYEDTVYLSDNAYAPYGTKNRETLIKRCIINTDFLLEKGCKIIVIACNTATTNIIDTLRKKYDTVFVGVEPPIKPAALASKTKTIGLLATQATIKSPLLLKTASTHLQNVDLIKQHGKGLVDFIERGNIDGEEIQHLLEKYLQNIRQKNADYLVLGCTHYPFLKPLIEKITRGHIKIIDSGLPVAKRIKDLLHKNNLQQPQKTAQHYFYTTENNLILKDMVAKITPDFLKSEQLFFSSFV